MDCKERERILAEYEEKTRNRLLLPYHSTEEEQLNRYRFLLRSHHRLCESEKWRFRGVLAIGAITVLIWVWIQLS